MEPRPPRTRRLHPKHRLKSPTNPRKMPRPRQSNANRNGKKKRLLPNRSHIRKIRQTPKRRTTKSHHPRTHAHPKIIRRRLHPPQQSPRRISRPHVQPLHQNQRKRTMKPKQITYYINNKPHRIKAKPLTTIIQKATGLMFRRQSPPLLFVFNKTKTLTIHSLFCKPFKAIWLDNKFHATKITDVKKWKLNISGKGKYLLEIPL